jgi:HEAT repeats
MILTAVLLAGLPDTSALSAQSTQTPTPAASAPTQSVTVDRGVLTVDVRDMPLDEVLKTISEQSGVNITVHSGGAAKVTQTFSAVGLDQGIRRLAPAYNVVLVYGSAEAEGRPGATRLVEVHVYETSKSPVTAVVDPQQRTTQLRTVAELSRKAHAQEPGALTSLAGLLAGDPDPAIRRSAAEALASLREAEAVNALRSGASDQDPTVRGRSLLSLGQMRDEGSVAIVAQGAMRDPDASVRRSAVWALSTLQSEEARRALEVAASDADPLVKQAAAGALKQWALRGKSN